MAEGTATFGGSMKTSGKLHQMLNQSDITPQKLFSVNNMTGDIIQNIQAFLNFCLKRRQFTHRMLKISLNSSYETLLNDQVKRVAQHTIQVLTNDQDALSSFLFSKNQDTKSSANVQQNAQAENTITIQSEAERLFGGDSPRKNEQAAWQNQPNAFQKFQLVTISLEHLKEKTKNETCLGYINKLYSSLLRRQGNLFLQYLKQKPEYLQLLIENLHYISIGSIIALTLSCEDKSGQYKHEQLKKEIFKKILEYGFTNMPYYEKFEGFIATVQEILSSTKQSYYQYFQDFKRCANILVNEQTLRYFYKYLNKSEQQFGSASIYLQLIVKRINSQTQQHDYYRQNQTSEPTMKFQHQFFFNELQNLVNFIGVSQKYSSMIRVSFLGFLISLIRNMQKAENINTIKNKDMRYQDLFKKIIIYYGEQKVAGLVKNYLFQLLKLIAKNFNEKQTKQIAQWLLNAKIQQQTLKRIFADTSLDKSNANQSSCFILSILFDVQNKYNAFVSQYAQKNELNLTNIFQRYRTKLANYGQEEQSPNCDDIELNFRLITKSKNNFFLKNNDNQDDSNNQTKKQTSECQNKQKQKEKQKEVQTQIVGKNSVVIPVLNLPHKAQVKVIIEQEAVQPFKLPSQISRQALIRDLKNTRIEIPEKFKQKKSEENEKKPEQKAQISQKVQKQEKKQLNLHIDLHQKIKEAGAQKIQVPNLKGDQGKKLAILPNEGKYFIRHVQLF